MSESEILTTAEGGEVVDTNIPDEEFDSYIEELGNLGFFEAMDLNKKVNDSMNQWQAVYEAMKQIEEESENNTIEGGIRKKDSDINKSIMEANVLSEVGIDTASEFNNQYSKHIERLQRISSKLSQVIDKYWDKTDSTTFVTKEMIGTLQKKMDAMKPEDINYLYNRKIARNTLTVLEDRARGGYENRQFIADKFNIYLKGRKKEIRKSFREEGSVVGNDQRTKAIKDLCHRFNESDVARFMSALDDSFNGRADVKFLFTNFLAKLAANGKKDGTDSYVRFLILDLRDIDIGKYDIEGTTYREYLDNLWDKCYIPATKYLEENNLELKNGKETVVVSEFGLPQFYAPGPDDINESNTTVDTDVDEETTDETETEEVSEIDNDESSDDFYTKNREVFIDIYDSEEESSENE